MNPSLLSHWHHLRILLIILKFVCFYWFFFLKPPTTLISSAILISLHSCTLCFVVLFLISQISSMSCSFIRSWLSLLTVRYSEGVWSNFIDFWEKKVLIFLRLFIYFIFYLTQHLLGRKLINPQMVIFFLLFYY